MNTVKGNLISLAKQGNFDVIVHGCNIYHVMGAGIAAQIREQFPQAYEADKKTARGDYNKLGTYSQCLTEYGFTIVNAYTQAEYGSDCRKVNYEAVARVFESIARDFNGLRIGFPMIGAGLAKGNWKIISTIIEESLKGQNFTLVEFVPGA